MNEEPHLLPGAQREGYQPVRPSGADEAPLRAEPFSAAQMAVHGRQLAARHELVRDGVPERLLARLERNADAIRDACAALAHAANDADPLAPAAEFLLDHYPLIDEQARFARHHLSPNGTRALPCLANGNARVYQLALEAVSHGDGRLERDSLARFVAAYQEGAPLLLAELRAIPVMLRLALVENLRRLALRLEQGRAQRALARDWAERMIATAANRRGDLVLVMADMARTVQPMGGTFVAELARRLHGRGGALAQVLEWLATRLADEDSGIEAEVRADDQRQAADQASLANSIASLRLLGAIDWRDFLETVSPVEQALRQDPCGTYGRMDAATRGHYRRAVERLARASCRGEADVAAEALALAGAAPGGDGQDARTRHVGYYLVAEGVPALRARLGMRAAPLAALRRAVRRRPLLTYLGAIGALTLLFTAALLVHAWRSGAGAPLLVVFGLLAAFGASELGQALARMMAARLATPRPLPRMDASAGIPIEARTLLAVPALLDSEEKVAALCATLEVHYLANRDPNLRFCLLSDFADAAQETVFGDAELLEQARAAIAALNARHGEASGQSSPFLLLHRPRSWSAGEGAWIGRERKRGQFADLNALLRGGARERFCLVEGNLDGLELVRYVIALDAGARLPRDGARRLVAAMLHPLNRPLLDASGRVVVAGHALLQPRTTSALPAEDASRYARLSGGSGSGTPPAPRGAPELDQDLFGASVYGGQGIYEVDACERVLGRLPQGQILAHELLAGCCLRAGLLDEVALAAEVPARYSDDVARHHRWIRGDWQLAGWLRARAPGMNGKREPNPLPPLARWTLFDGLRRSLVAPTLLAALLLCWALLPEPAFWSGAALAVFFLPAFLGMFVRLADQPHDMLWRQHLANWWRDTRFALGHAALDTAFLPHRAWYGTDAIVRTGWRMLVSRRKLLQWRSTRLVRSSTDMESNWRSMWFAPAFAVVTAVLLSFLHPFALFAAAPLLLLWFLSPVLAWWLSLPHPRRTPSLSAGQTGFLAALARRHWGYFESLSGAQDHWFAPDRLQEHPHTMLAHCTSPAGIGIGLLSTLSAWDFGFLPQSGLLARLRASFDSMALLERHRGHFYAGYDTRTLAPLAPIRIDTAASGHLAGHLLTLATGLEQLADRPIAGEQALAGMRATLRVVEEHAAKAPRVVHEALAHCAQVLDPDNCRKAGTLPGLVDCLQAASAAAAALPALLPEDADPELRAWCARLDEDGRAAHADLLAQAPWMRAVHEYVLDASLTRIPTLRELAAFTPPAGGDDATRALAALVEEGTVAARARLDEIAALAGQARAFADMDFGLLYDRDTRLLAAGCDVTERRLEDAACGQLASEARLASFIGIAHGQLPQAHWFALGRQLGVVGGEQVLLSRGGALRDYLMPFLVMPAWRGTLLDQSARAAIHVQADHARRHGVPWGVSDCACNTVDAALHYACRAFGVPGLGLRRGLGRDLVVAPHAAMLGLMVAPEQACANLERMAGLGLVGRYGFYEAIDYTGARLRQGQHHAVVRAFLAQHQGMGLLALSHLLLDRPMQKRFEADPRLRAALPLLQERVPRSGAFDVAGIEPAARPRAPLPVRAAPRPGRAQPEVQLLSNGGYHLVVDSEGGSDSRWHGLALTRRRGDATDGSGGLSCYLRDLDNGVAWTAAWQPALAEPEQYEALFPEGSAQLRRRDRGIELVTEIVVSPEDDIELRRMRIRNRSAQARAIELTSYVEVLPAPHDPDGARPAQCAILPGDGAILCTRPPREQDEPMPWLLHLMTVHGAVHGGTLEAASFETSRARFLGRADGNPLPAALRSRAPLGGMDGAEPDPALAIRRVLALAPGDEAVVDLVLGVAATRAAALALATKLRDRDAAGRVFALAWTHSQAFLAGLDMRPEDARLYGRLAGHVLYPRRALRADPALIARNRLGQPGLWPYAISGEHPLVLLHLRDAAHLMLARQLVQAHACWNLKGLAVDLVIWYEGEALGEQLMELVAAMAPPSGSPGAVFVLAFDQLAEDDRVLMQAAACVVLTDEGGSLAEHLRRASAAPAPPTQPPPTMYPEEAAENWSLHTSDPAPRQLVLDNGNGGFSEDGREYLVRTGPGRYTPAPWTNVLASPAFGSQVSESGQATSWSENARDFRITTSDDDPLREAGGEAFYLRDEHSGAFWSPTALPAPSGGDYLTRHGFGYSVFEHAAHGIHSELTSFVALDAPLKYTVLRVRNDSSTPRRLSATGYVAWVLGRTRAEAMHVVTGRDAESGALVARNAWHADFADRTAFFHVDAEPAAYTCDRMEFIGRGRGLANPAALARATLSSASGAAMGAALDPCAALQVAFELQPGEQKELVFVLGVGGEGEHGAASLVRRHGGLAAAGAALEKVRAWWNETLGAVRVTTPDPALDVLANGWLLYQAIAGRMWAGAGGAIGFGEVLQDALALVHARPQLLRAQLLLCAARQYVEGDVQHCRHAPSGRGLRTGDTNDALWLPFAVCRYVAATGDSAVLDESLPYLAGRGPDPGARAHEEQPAESSVRGDLYEHCVRALRYAMRFGAHGLPMLGDVGESAWLGFFMAEVLQRFAGLAERRADYGFATICRATAQVLAAQLEEHAWDGERYRRTPGEDGTPAGPADRDAQSWSVLSGVADPQRAASAMEAFAAGGDDCLDTRSAAWTAMAFAQLGQGERAWTLLDAINPARRTATREACAHYGIEPYVMADGVPPAHPYVGCGRGSWYTSSAGWTYRLIVESLLGIGRQGERLVLSPQLPRGWPGFRLDYRYRNTLYEIEVRFAEADALLVDGREEQGNQVTLADDGRTHRVELLVARRHGAAIAAASEEPQSKSIT